MIELSFTDHNKLKQDGRNFNCATCPERIQKLRRCREDREDFTEKDGALWPIYINKGGELYNYCPGKATWDHQAVDLFRMLIVAAESKVMLNEGGLANQPDWYIDTLSWFLPRYDSEKFLSRARMILGDKKPTSNPGRGPTLKGKR